MVVPFGYKTAWLAVSERSAEAVADAIDLRHRRRATWEQGVAEAEEDRIFVSPPVGSWTLAIGTSLPHAEEEGWTEFLSATSSRLGEIQHFGTHRVVEYHAWALATSGRIIRAYAYLGERDEVLCDIGLPPPAELELRSGPNRGDHVDEELVLALAGRWSLDPRTLGSTGSSGYGLTGVRR